MVSVFAVCCFYSATHLICWKGKLLRISEELDLTVATILSQGGKLCACVARKEARVWP